MSEIDDNTGEDQELRSRSVSGLLWTVSRTGGMVGLRFVMLIVLARLLTPEDFGLMSAALVVLGFSAMFYELGVGPALVQRPEVTPAHIRAGMTGSLLMSLVFGVAVAAGAPLIASIFEIPTLAPVLVILAFEFPIQGVSVVSKSMMQRELRFKELAIIDVAGYALGYGIVGVTLALLGFGIWALVAAHLTVAFFSSIAAIAIGRYGLRPGFDRAAFKELMVFGGGFTLSRVFNYIARQGDNFVTGRWLGAAALGVYSRAYQLVVFPISQLTQVIGQVLFPAMAQIQTSTQRLSGAFRRGTTFMALVFAPLSVFAAVLAPEIVAVFLGSQWTEAVVPFEILALGMVFRAVYKMSDVLVQATGAVYRTAWRQAAYAIAVVGGAWIGQHWGLVGLSYGVLGALILNYALMSHLSVSLTSLTWGRFFKAHVPALMLTALTLATSLGMATWLRNIDSSNLVTLIATTLATFVVIGLLVYFRPSVLGPDQPWIYSISRELLRGFKRKQKSPMADIPESADAEVGELERRAT